MKKLFLLLALVCGVCAEAQFVTVKDGHFKRNGLPYRVNGVNMWYAAVTDAERLCRELDMLCELGVNNIRVMATAEGQPVIAQAGAVAQGKPGVYDENVLKGLDRLMVELEKRDMTAVLYLTNAWEWSGGFGVYLDWAGEGAAPDPSKHYDAYCKKVSKFSSNEAALKMYANHVKQIVGRVNSISGKKYSESPAIMAWQICNEPRAFAKESVEPFRKWLANAAAQIKAIDPNHLVSTGSEGSVGCMNANAGAAATAEYEKIHADKNIDYLTIHIWPTMWGWASKKDFARDLPKAKELTGKYIDDHLAVAERLGKPIVLEEFGYPRDSAPLATYTRLTGTEKGKVSDAASTRSRDEYFRFVYDRCRQLDGQNIWAWGGEAVPSEYLGRWTKGAAFSGDPSHEPQGLFSVYACDSATISIFRSARPVKRNYVSRAVEEKIEEMWRKLPSYELAQLFANCFPNNLDKAVVYEVGEDGLDDTFILTGDIEAMWLRDSGAQVWPYVALLGEDEDLRRLVLGVINRQLKCLNIDPYANAFNRTPFHGEWQSDETAMTEDLWERKWELDSPSYVLRLVYGYWLQTGDDRLIKSELFLTALDRVLDTFIEQQKWNGQYTSYKFLRTTRAMHDTMANYGWGAPVKACGLVSSAFRPSDDCTILQFLVPSNFMAADVLKKTAKMMRKVYNVEGKITVPEGATTMPMHEYLIATSEKVAGEIEAGLKQHAVAHTEKYGDVYAFEVDGFGGRVLGDDANVPSLLTLPYMTDMPINDPIYQNTRRMLLSSDNPYYFSGKAGAGIGSQHTGLDYIWPMSLIMQAMTSSDQAEIDNCLHTLATTTADTGLMHESFNKDNPFDFTRSWFAWCNTLFGELLIKLYDK